MPFAEINSYKQLPAKPETHYTRRLPTNAPVKHKTCYVRCLPTNAPVMHDTCYMQHLPTKCSGNAQDPPCSAHWTGLCLSFAFPVCALEHLTLVRLPFLTVVWENTCYHIRLQVILVSAHICYWAPCVSSSITVHDAYITEATTTRLPAQCFSGMRTLNQCLDNFMVLNALLCLSWTQVITVLLGLNVKFTLIPNLAWVDDEIIIVATKSWVGQNDGEHDYSLLNSLVETLIWGAARSRNSVLFTLSPTVPHAFALHTVL